MHSSYRLFFNASLDASLVQLVMSDALVKLTLLNYIALLLIFIAFLMPCNLSTCHFEVRGAIVFIHVPYSNLRSMLPEQRCPLGLIGIVSTRRISSVLRLVLLFHI